MRALASGPAPIGRSPPPTASALPCATIASPILPARPRVRFPIPIASPRSYSRTPRSAPLTARPPPTTSPYGTHLGLPLRPESNTGTEIGLRHENAVPGALSWTLVAFRNELTDLIDFNPSSFQTYNIAKARTQGVEAGIETRPAKGLRVFGATTWLDSEVRSADYYFSTGMAGDKLLRRPTLTLTLGVEVIPNDDWTFGALRRRISADVKTTTGIVVAASAYPTPLSCASGFAGFFLTRLSFPCASRTSSAKTLRPPLWASAPSPVRRTWV